MAKQASFLVGMDDMEKMPGENKNKNGDACSLFRSVGRKVAERGLADVLVGVLHVSAYRCRLGGERAPASREKYWKKLRRKLRGSGLVFTRLFAELAEQEGKAENTSDAVAARDALLRLCAGAAGDGLPGILDRVQKGVVFPDENAAACASGRELLRWTEQDNDEYMCVIYKTGRLAVSDGKLRYEEGYAYTPPQKGRHNHVVWPVIRAVAAAMLGRYKNDANQAGRFSINHSHPNCDRHAGDQLSGGGEGKNRLGDETVTRGKWGARAIYLTAPGTGKVYRYAAGMDIKEVNAAIRKDPEGAAVGDAGYIIAQRPCGEGRLRRLKTFPWKERF